MRFIFASLMMSIPWHGLVYAAPLSLDYGANTLDINADGHDDLMVRSRWENGNAFSFDRYLVMIRDGAVWQEVPFGDRYDYNFRTAESMDCVTADDMAFRTLYTFELNKTGWLEVTRYTREKERKTNRYNVKQTHFKLIERAEQVPGLTRYAFEQTTSTLMPQLVCDVREVMPYAETR
jgi:hypothetical protein